MAPMTAERSVSEKVNEEELMEIAVARTGAETEFTMRHSAGLY